MVVRESVSELKRTNGTDTDLLIVLLITPISSCVLFLKKIKSNHICSISVNVSVPGGQRRAKKCNAFMSRSECIKLLWKAAIESSWRPLMQQSSRMLRS